MNHRRPTFSRNLLAPVLLISLALSACNPAPPPSVQATGSAILDRNMPATVDHVAFSMGGVVTWQEGCDISLTRDTRINGHAIPDYAGQSMWMPFGPSHMLWMPEHEFDLTATKTNGHWRIESTSLSPDEITATEFETSVRGCVTSLTRWADDEANQSGAVESASRRSWDTVPPTPTVPH